MRGADTATAGAGTFAGCTSATTGTDPAGTRTSGVSSGRRLAFAVCHDLATTFAALPEFTRGSKTMACQSHVTKASSNVGCVLPVQSCPDPKKCGCQIGPMETTLGTTPGSG